MMIVLIGENIANDGFFMMLLMMSRRTLSTWTLPSLSGDDDDDDDDNDDDNVVRYISMIIKFHQCCLRLQPFVDTDRELLILHPRELSFCGVCLK